MSMLRLFFVLAIFLGVQARAEEHRLRIVSTNSILDDLVQQIGGGWVDSKSLIPAGTEAHSWQPSPDSVKALTEADLVIINGLNLEPWMDELVRNSGYKGTVAVASTGIKTLQGEAEEHDHADAHHHGDGPDPHIWQNVRNVIQMSDNIQAALSKADPAHAGVFRASNALYDAQLSALDAWIKRQIGSIPKENRKLVTSHGAFRYFEEAYGVEIRGIEGISAEQEADAKQLSELIRFIHDEHVRAVLLENVMENKTARRLAQETGIRVGGELYSDSVAAYPHPASTYIGLMRFNVLTVLEAVK